MPDPLGTLTSDEQKKVIAWLNVHWGSVDRCPMHSGPTTWGVAPQIVRTVGFGPAAALGKTFPMIVAICGTCGLVMFVSAVKVGILAADA